MGDPARATKVCSYAFSCEVFASVALQNSSQIIQEHPARRFTLLSYLMFLVFLGLCHCLRSTQPPRKQLAPRRNHTMVHCALTTNFTQNTVDLAYVGFFFA